MVQTNQNSGIASFSISYLNEGIKNRKPLEDFHDSYELAYFIRADIHIFVEDTKYHIKDGDLLLINPMDIHRIFYNPDFDYTRYVVHFKSGFIQDMLNTMGMESLIRDLQKKRQKRCSVDLKQRTKIEERFRTLQENYARSVIQGKDQKTSEATLKLELLLLLLKYLELSKSQTLFKSSHDENRVKNIIHYIDKHYMNSIYLKDLEQQFANSKYYISHYFKETTQFTVMEYLQYRRVTEAQKLLIQTAKPIIEIAFECGFHSLQHFYSVFKKRFGKSPGRYRKEDLERFKQIQQSMGKS